jgi:putative nucleotidyltransferase with HDIG domain
MTNKVNREAARESFRHYVSSYDASDERILLKVAHTYRVAALSEHIANSLGLSDGDIDLAWLCGLLHDIGRFEQVRRYGTFADSRSVNHAHFGASILFDASPRCRPLIRDFLPVGSTESDELLHAAISTHGDYRLPTGLDDRTHMFCDILRDADKVDILQVNCTEPAEAIYDVTERELLESPVSPSVIDAFREHRTLRHDERTHPADVVVSHLCFVFELVFPESRRLARDQGYVFRLARRPFTNPETRQAFDGMEEELRAWLSTA